MKWFWRRRSDDQLSADLRDEIQFHLDSRAELDPLSARRRFGNVTATQEEARAMHVNQFLETAGKDLRYALRGFGRNPIFAGTAVLTVALGIGAATAVFSVVDRILFRGLPYPDDDRLVSLGLTAPIEQQEFMLGTDYLEWRDQQKPFATLTSWTPGGADCDLTDQNPVRLSCALVESTFLPTLGIEPVVGRNFTREEDRPNAPKVVLLSYGLWQSRFGGDREVAQKTISLDGKPARIVGVLPAQFEMPTLARADLLVPQALDEAAQRPPNTGRVLRSIARLKEGVSIQQAKAQLQPLFQNALGHVPAQFRKEVKLQVRSLRDRQTEDTRLASWVLLASVMAVLLIACANVANLLLARAASRRRELAVRVALGAGRARLIRQSLTESLTLGLAGGAAGCVFASVLLRLFVAIAPQGILRLDQAALDSRVLLVALALALVSSVLFGLAPALESPRAEILAGSRVLGSSRNLFRQSLVAAQIAISLVLLTGSSLLLRTLWNLESVPLGMRAETVVTAGIVLGQQRYSAPERQLAFFDDLEARLARLPGVTTLAVSDSLPPAGAARSRVYASIRVEGRPSFPEGTGGMVLWRSVTPGYFSALGIPILRGRGFREEDRAPNEYAIVFSETLARRMFPGEDALGKRVQLWEGEWFTIAGIAGNVKNSGLDNQDDPEYYVCRRHSPDDAYTASSVIIRSPMNPQVVASFLRAEIAALDPSLPAKIETMNERARKLAARPRFNAVLLGLFAGIGLLLAAIGLYGVISFLVTQRTQEIGVRMALGATPREVAKLILMHAARWTLVGAILGLAGSVVAARSLGALLFQVPRNDPWTLAAALALLLAVALVAAWMPARRAARVDPTLALRAE